MVSDWNPNLYLQFQSERTQPSIDLINRIASADPRTIIDIGCGPGNSTQVLVKRWPNAEITGLDSSAAMIEQAAGNYPDQEWILADVLTYAPEIKFDVVFSNAAIQWVPKHGKLIEKFFGMLTGNGLLAVQVPLFWDMPLGRIIRDIAEEGRWKKQTEGVSDLFTIHDYAFYYDCLSDLFSAIDIWETHYFYLLADHIAILEMMRSTGLKPFLERLGEDSDKKMFEAAVLEGVQDAYPVQKNGKVILPFRRLFFIGYK